MLWEERLKVEVAALPQLSQYWPQSVNNKDNNRMKSFMEQKIYVGIRTDGANEITKKVVEGKKPE